MKRSSIILMLGGLALLGAGSWLGLTQTDPERYMGEVQRIFFIHVPTAWNGMLALTFAAVSAFAFLWNGDWKWDARHEAWVEIGVVLSALLCIQGSIWARPTWGVWWDWDPRLTTMAVLLLAFIGIMALRHFVENPLQRATWSAVATIIAYVNVPIVYFSVQWWNSLHQVQSTPATVSTQYHLPLRLNAFGFLLLMIGWAIARASIADARRVENLTPPPTADFIPNEEVTA